MGPAGMARAPFAEAIFATEQTMTHSRGIGGSAEHDLRREGTVTPREHNLRRKEGGTGKAEALVDPERPHKPPSAREVRRAEEREAARHHDDDPAESEG